MFILCVAGGAYGQSASSLVSRSKKETDPAQKVVLLTQAVKKSPKYAVAWHHRGDAYRQMGKYKKAVS